MRKNTAATTTSEAHPSSSCSSHLITTSPDSQANPHSQVPRGQSSNDQGKRRGHTTSPTSQGTDTADTRRSKSSDQRQTSSSARTLSYGCPRNTYISSRPQTVLFLSLSKPRRTTSKEFCNHSKRNGHTRSTYRWQNWCDYWYRVGHITGNAVPSLPKKSTIRSAASCQSRQPSAPSSLRHSTSTSRSLLSPVTQCLNAKHLIPPRIPTHLGIMPTDPAFQERLSIISNIKGVQANIGYLTQLCYPAFPRHPLCSEDFS